MYPPRLQLPPAPSARRFVSALYAVAALLSVAAVILGAYSVRQAQTTSTLQNIPEQRARAQTKLCDRFNLAAWATGIESNDPDGQDSFARIAFINAALTLDIAANDPSLDREYSDAARALADTYQTAVAQATAGMVTKAEYLASIDDLIAKQHVLLQLCGK